MGWSLPNDAGGLNVVESLVRQRDQNQRRRSWGGRLEEASHRLGRWGKGCRCLHKLGSLLELPEGNQSYQYLDSGTSAPQYCEIINPCAFETLTLQHFVTKPQEAPLPVSQAEDELLF